MDSNLRTKTFRKWIKVICLHRSCGRKAKWKMGIEQNMQYNSGQFTKNTNMGVTCAKRNGISHFNKIPLDRLLFASEDNRCTYRILRLHLFRSSSAHCFHTLSWSNELYSSVPASHVHRCVSMVLDYCCPYEMLAGATWTNILHHF